MKLLEEKAQFLAAEVPPGSAVSEPRRTQIVWLNVFIFTVLHVGAVYGLYLSLVAASWQTCLWTFLLYVSGGLGITIGAHRLWAHRSFKAKWPMRLILVILNSVSFQNDIIEWSRDHRCHHKWSETDADPHNATRGLFFSHMGWLMVRKHPEVIRKGKTIDMSDLLADPLLVFQRKYYLLLVTLFCFVVPTAVPVLLWKEDPVVAFCFAALFRYSWTLHMTWTVNSLAHMYGFRPYDPDINPRENYLSVAGTMGEGYHNYHHTFPQDYKASEFPWRLNLSTFLIDICASIGWAYDRKAVDPVKIRQKVEATSRKLQ